MITRRLRRSSLECQALPEAGEDDPIVITRLPFTHFVDVPSSVQPAGTIIQWSPPNNASAVTSYQYDFDGDGLLVDGPTGEPGSNPIDLADAPTVQSFGYDGIGVYSNLRTIELIAESTDAYDEATEAANNLSITINYDLGASTGVQITLPLNLKYKGSAAQFSWDLPPGAVFNVASIIAHEMTNLRLTLHAIAWPLAA